MLQKKEEEKDDNHWFVDGVQCTSENFCDLPWKLLGQVSTVGCKELLI